MVYMGASAVQRARTLYRSGYKGLCLQRVRLIYGVGAKYGSAQSAWNAASLKHRDRNIPVGAPVFWAINSGKNKGLGHVAVYCGNGIVSSTTVNNGSPGEVGLDALTRSWGMTYYGWTEDLNGVRVVPASAPAPAPTPAPSSGWVINTNDPGQVRNLQAKLNNWKAVQRLGRLLVDGVWGPKTAKAVVAVQRANPGLFGLADGVVGPKTAKALGL